MKSYRLLVAMIVALASGSGVANAQSGAATRPTGHGHLAAATDACMTHVAAGSPGDPDLLIRLLVRAGDPASARKVLSSVDRASASRLAGLIAAYEPGNATVAGAKTILGDVKPMGGDEELGFGLAVGLAQQGKYEQAVTVAKTIGSESTRNSAMGVIVTHQPTKQRLDELIGKTPLDKLWGVDFAPLARSAMLAGDPALADAMLQTVRKRVPAGGDPVDHVIGAIVDGYLRLNKRDEAAEQYKQIGSALIKLDVVARFAREPASRGDVAGVQQAIDATRINNLARPSMTAMLVYAHARSGDWDAARKLCEASPPPAQDRTRTFALRYGMLAAAQHATGRSDEAKATLDHAAGLINQIKTPDGKWYAAERLLKTAVLGVEFVSYDAGYTDFW